MSINQAIDTSIATKLAIKYSFKTGIDFELLYAEALEAYWRAVIDPNYDPRKSAFSTYAYIVVNSRMLDIEYAHRRQRAHPHCPLDEAIELPTNEPSVEKIVFFSELLQQLPEDGRLIIDLVFNVIGEVPSYRIRAVIRNMLKKDWTHARLEQAFQSIVQMLHEAESF